MEISTADPLEGVPMKRREFVGMSAALLLMTATAGCAGVVATRVRPTDGAVTVNLADHPRLNEAGGSLALQVEDGGPSIYVLALGDEEYAALSPICTHLGCTVDLQGERLVCPCHGSTYDRRGEVLRGPAEAPLASYPVAVESGGRLVIRLGE